jgi:hypothetical protein
MRGTVIPASLKYPPLMKAMLLNLQAWEDISLYRPADVIIWQKRSQVIRMVGHSLGDSFQACSDESIAAIIALMGFEVGAFRTHVPNRKLT